MFPKCVVFFILNLSVCWSNPMSPTDKSPTPYTEDVGEPLILTPLIKSNNIDKARNLSTVVSLLNNSNIVSHSGYLTVNETYNSNLFFWFFPKNGSDWQNASLLLWLQGGPGASSLFGLFNENGPYEYTEAGLQLRNISWTNDYNVLYIDQPVGTGFSFTNSSSGYISTQEQVADHLYEALLQFYQLFPEVSQNALYMTGESYAGKYIPAISYKIHTMKMANLTNINLKGLFMISALTDGLLTGLANYCFQINVIDYKTKIQLEQMEEVLERLIKQEVWIMASIVASDFILAQIKNLADVNAYDYRKHLHSEKEGYEYAQFLLLPEVRQKIHTGNRTYQVVSEAVYYNFTEDMAKSVINVTGELLKHYPIAFVGGQYDIRTAHPLVVNVLKKLEFGEFYNRTRLTKNRFIVDGVDAGYYTSSGSLTDILIRGAGHMVPKDQPRAALVALNRFINNTFFVNNATKHS